MGEKHTHLEVMVNTHRLSLDEFLVYQTAYVRYVVYFPTFPNKLVDINFKILHRRRVSVDIFKTILQSAQSNLYWVRKWHATPKADEDDIIGARHTVDSILWFSQHLRSVIEAMEAVKAFHEQVQLAEKRLKQMDSDELEFDSSKVAADLDKIKNLVRKCAKPFSLKIPYFYAHVHSARIVLADRQMGSFWTDVQFAT